MSDWMNTVVSCVEVVSVFSSLIITFDRFYRFQSLYVWTLACGSGNRAFGHMQVCRTSLHIIIFPMPISYVSRVSFSILPLSWSVIERLLWPNSNLIHLYASNYSALCSALYNPTTRPNPALLLWGAGLQ